MVVYGGRTRRNQGCESGRNQPHGSSRKASSGHEKQTKSVTSGVTLDGLLPEPGYDGKCMILGRLFKARETREKRLYEAIVAAARHVRFYEDMAVADTIDGRFDMIVLHLFLVLNRLKGQGVEDIRQRLTDEFFADMDRSLRELGVSDVAVGKKVRRIAESYYGRVMAYDRALAAGPVALEEAISRNIYPDGASGESTRAMTAYFVDAVNRLASAPLNQILQGELRLP